MNNEEIEKFLDKQKLTAGQSIKIDFKKRNTLYGIFLRTDDFNDLKTKNLWRIVVEPRIQEYQTSKDMSLSRIFNGSEISRMAVAVAAKS